MKFNQKKLNRFQTEYIPKIDAVLSKEIKNSSNENLLVNSMQYSLMAGGKRLRPLLVLAVLESYGVKITDELIKISCAVELLHTYSLIQIGRASCRERV